MTCGSMCVFAVGPAILQNSWGSEIQEHVDMIIS